MDQRFGNTWRMTVNEKKFIETALLSDLRVDGRSLFDYRQIIITFGREDGTSEVQLGETRVMSLVSSQLIKPYKDRPNEGTISIYTEFSPMADSSFEAGRPGESAVELGRIIDRGLRESRAVDTESLCVSAGKFVWSIRVDLHILDNGGNLVDAANIAALAALLTFRRPECTLGGGQDGQDVILYPPEVREPLPLIIHHLPIAITFAFLGKDNITVIDPTHYEEAIMKGKMTVTINTSGDICGIQKAGGDGVFQNVILQCLRIASVKASDITTKINNAVESYEEERALRKIKRHTYFDIIDVSEHIQTDGYDFSVDYMERLKLGSNECTETLSHLEDISDNTRDANFLGGPSCWDPYSKGIDFDALKASLVSRGSSMEVQRKKVEEPKKETLEKVEVSQPPSIKDINIMNMSSSSSSTQFGEKFGEKTLKDAIKPKHQRKKKNVSLT